MSVTCHQPATKPEVESEDRSRPRNGLYVSWKWLRRADSIADGLGIPSFTVKHWRPGLPLPLVVVRYFLQASSTFLLLVRRRPRVVFVTNPPVAAVIPVYLYALLFRARYVVDSHTGCFKLSHWKKLTWVQKLFSKRAAFSLVHNKANARTLDGWGVDYEIFPSLPPELPVTSEPRGAERPLVMFICSHDEDEPIAEFLEAAQSLSHVDFRITGKASRAVQENHPENVTLTGYLTEDEYLRLLVEADLLVALTKQDDTLLYGAQEAIAMHKPIVISDTATLREYFPDGTVFTRNTVDGLVGSIGDALERRAELTEAMALFEKRYRENGQARLERLAERVGL